MSKRTGTNEDSLDQWHLRQGSRPLVGRCYTIQGALVIAVAIEAADQISAISVAERNRYVLGGHVEDVAIYQHREVAGSEIEASTPSSRNLDSLQW